MTMSWQPPPQRPVLHVNASPEGEKALALLEAYDIDFETQPRDGPAVTLHWNGLTFADIFRIADFLAMARRVVPALRKTCRRRDEVPPGTPIPLR